MTRVIVPADADFEVAFARSLEGRITSWAGLKGLATQVAAERLVRENIAEQQKTSAEIQRLTGRAWLVAQERFTMLLAEHDELLSLAFPSRPQEVSRG